MGDSYPTGDPAGLSHEGMMAQVVKLDIQYWFGYIQKCNTDKMIEIFNESLRRLSEQRLLIRQFDAIQPSEVSEAVHRFVVIQTVNYVTKFTYRTKLYLPMSFI